LASFVLFEGVGWSDRDDQTCGKKKREERREGGKEGR